MVGDSRVSSPLVAKIPNDMKRSSKIMPKPARIPSPSRPPRLTIHRQRDHRMRPEYIAHQPSYP